MLDVWRIYYDSNCRHTTPQKPKLVVIVCISTQPMGFLINTDIPRFIKNNPELLLGQIVIKTADYNCLSHDSYIDCTQLYPFENAILESRDCVNNKTKMAIKMAVSASVTIERCYKKIILM